MNHHYPLGSRNFTWPDTIPLRSKARRDISAALALGAFITAILLSKWAGAAEHTSRAARCIYITEGDGTMVIVCAAPSRSQT
jgi:hypothetical protein